MCGFLLFPKEKRFVGNWRYLRSGADCSRTLLKLLMKGNGVRSRKRPQTVGTK
jgi:hypothetical protein